MLLAWRDRTVPTAGALVADLFKSADRVLLEYADKAESNAVQARFFEGQRELWLKQDQVVSQFHDALFHELFQFTRPAKREGGPGPHGRIGALQRGHQMVDKSMRLPEEGTGYAELNSGVVAHLLVFVRIG